jgi:PAS domain S-box-containing protein
MKEDLLDLVNKLEAALDTIAEAIVLVGADRRVEWCNQNFAKLVAKSKEDIIGNNLVNILSLTKNSQPLNLDAYPHIKLLQEQQAEEYEFQQGDRSLILAISSKPIASDRGEKAVILSIQVKKSWQTDTALRRSELKYRKIFENSQVGIARTRLKDGLFLDANQRCAEILGFNSAQELIERKYTHEFYVNPGERAAILQQLYDRGGVCNLEIQLRRQNGSLTWCLLSLHLNAEDNCIESVIADLSDRRQTEEALKISEAKYRDLVEAANCIILHWDIDGQVKFINNYGQRFFGFGLNETIDRQTIGKIFPSAEDKENLQQLLDNIFDHPHDYLLTENENIDKQGKRVWMAWSNRPRWDENGNLVEILSVGTDISERKQTEIALRRSELKFRNLFENSLAGIYCCRFQDGLVLEANQRFVELMGYDSAEEVVEKKHNYDFCASPETRHQMIEELRQHGEVNNFEIKFRRKDGFIGWGLYSARLNREDDTLISVITDISDRKQAEMELADSERSLRKQSQALTSLAQHKALSEGNLQIALQIITETAAIPLEVERVSIWLLDRDRTKLKCVDLYERSRKRHSARIEHTQADHPHYFSILYQLEHARTITAHDSQRDRRMQEFLEDYLLPEQIMANLDAPIRVSGEIVGIVAFEHVGAIHHWSLMEQNFAASIADFIALALETKQRQQTQAILRRSNALLKAQQEAAPDGILVVDEHQRIVSFNQRFCELWQVPRQLISQNSDRQLLNYVVSQLANPEEFLEKVTYLYQHPTEISRDEIVFRDKRVFDRYSSPIQSSAGEHYGRIWYFSNITERKQKEEALRLIVEGTAAQTGAEFFRSCVRYLAEVLQVRYAWIAEITSDCQDRLRTLAFWTGNNFGKTFVYNLSGTPCAGVIQGSKCRYPDSVTKYFPDNAHLANLRAESYWGVPIVSPTGTILGILVVVDVEPLEDRNLKEQELILEIFAARAGAELERQRAENALARQLQRALLLEKITQDIRQSLDLNKILQTTVDRIGISFKVCRCQIFSYQTQPIDKIRVVAEYLVPNCSAMLGIEIPLKSAACLEQAFSQDRAAPFLNVYEDPSLEKSVCVYEQFKVKSLIAVRTSYQGETNGAIVVHQCDRFRQWTQDEIDLIEAVAAQVGIAIAQAKLLEQEKLQRQELEVAKHSAEVANRAKSEFLANMSHELRTPLNAILGFAQLMERDSNLNGQQQESLAIINRSGEHLLNLINDVLEMSKIEAGKTILSCKPFDLSRLLQHLYEMFQARAQAKQLKLNFELAEDLPQYINADEGKLRQVLINLLGNAVKFTDTGGVTLRVKAGGLSSVSGDRRQDGLQYGEVNSPSSPQSGGAEMPRSTEAEVQEIGQPHNGAQGSDAGSEHAPPLHPTPYTPHSTPLHPYTLLFEVEDTGRGIIPEDRDKLFEPFVQTSTIVQNEGGTGLGLAISHRFVQLMGGELSFTSSVGEGSTFSFAIEVAVADADRVEHSAPKQRVLTIAPGQQNYRILVVDDRQENRDLLVQLLASVGFQTRTANNGEEAIEVWQQWQPDLIWMDLRMPVMDGYTATQQIKATPQGQKTVIIALTATVFEEQRSSIFAAGCDDLVRKPFQEQVIFEKLAEHLQVKYLYQEQANAGSLKATVHEQIPLQSTDLSMMSRDWRNSLQQAAMEVDGEWLKQLIEQIPNDCATLKQGLQESIRNYDFDEIIRLTQDG